MEIYPAIELEEMPRMADFAKWGCAIAEAIGYSQDEFLKAYNANIDRQIEEALNSSDVASVILYYLTTDEKLDVLEGTPSEVLTKLKKVSEMAGVDRKRMPKNAWSLGRRIRDVQPNLEAYGFEVDLKRGKKRKISIRRSKELKPEPKEYNFSTDQGIHSFLQDRSEKKSVGDVSDISDASEKSSWVEASDVDFMRAQMEANEKESDKNPIGEQSDEC